MLRISELFVYPIKSLGGISLTSARVTDRGFEHDRRWMLVNERGQFMTQRTTAELALFSAEVRLDGLLVSNKNARDSILIPFSPSAETMMVEVWGDRCRGNIVSNEVNDWFSDHLSSKCSLVYMTDATRRRVDGRYAQNKEITSFSDAYPFLIIGQSSLNDLNARMGEALPINRFRPNIVFTGGQPFEEDTWAHFNSNGIDFFGVKLCARCVMTTINQEEAVKGKEPLKTLATYRMKDKKIFFGQNIIHKGEGLVHVGDSIEIKERKKARLSLPVL